MRINQEDKILLGRLCSEYGIEVDKIINLLGTIQNYELKEKRHGVYDAIEEIIKGGKDEQD
jgi:hypothetical protein